MICVHIKIVTGPFTLMMHACSEMFLGLQIMHFPLCALIAYIEHYREGSFICGILHCFWGVSLGLYVYI